MKATKIRTAGKVIGVVGGLGASALIAAVCTPIVLPLGVVGAIASTLGSAGLGGIAADKVYEWYVMKTDQIANSIEELSESI